MLVLFKDRKGGILEKKKELSLLLGSWKGFSSSNFCFSSPLGMLHLKALNPSLYLTKSFIAICLSSTSHGPDNIPEHFPFLLQWVHVDFFPLNFTEKCTNTADSVKKKTILWHLRTCEASYSSTIGHPATLTSHIISLSMLRFPFHVRHPSFMNVVCCKEW